MVHEHPAVATVATAEGASAFARHYISVLQLALASGDTRALERISDPGCGGCTALAGAVKSAARAGQRVAGGAFVVDFAEAPPPEAGETTVEMRYARRSGMLVDAAGAKVADIPPEGPIDAQMRMRFTGDDWVVLGFRQAQS